jgi:hypothetical protein
MLAIWAVMFGALIYSVAYPPPDAVNSPGTVFLFMLPALPIMAVVIIIMFAFQSWRAHLKHLIPQDVVLSEEAMFFATSEGSGTIPWTSYQHFKETRKSFILWQRGTRQWVLFPKRGFTSREDLQRARWLFEGHLRRSRWFFG